MPARRKTFRIEEMMRSGVILPSGRNGRRPGDRAFTPPIDKAAPHDEVSRICAELAAVIVETERATHRILAAAEEIDQAAKSLSASVRTEPEHALTADIQDHIIGVMEACNYQDLAGQRVSKVLTTLSAITDTLSAAVPVKMPEKTLMNGPKLEGAAGHVSQSDIDAIFAA